jgi:hypothetical protein
VTKAPTSEFHVPPGQGKASTKDRNARRKIAKAMRKAAAATGDVVIPAIHRTQANGSNVPVVNGTTTLTTSALPVPKAMANRNKKKGFLKEMMAVQGTKTVFDDDRGVEEGAVNEPAPNGVSAAPAQAISPAAPEQPTAERSKVVNNDFAVPLAPAPVAPEEEVPEMIGSQWYSPSSVAEHEIPINLFVTSVQHRHAPFHNRPTRKTKPAAQDINGHVDSQTSSAAPPTVRPAPPVRPEPLPAAKSVLMSNMIRLAELARQKTPVSHESTPIPSNHAQTAIPQADRTDLEQTVEALFQEARREYINLRAVDISSATEGMLICWPVSFLHPHVFRDHADGIGSRAQPDHLLTRAGVQTRPRHFDDGV